MNTSSLIYESPIALIDCDRDGPREILLIIDWEEQTITAETRNTRYDGTPEYRFHRRGDAYPLPPTVDASALKGWVDEHIAPLTDRLATLYKKTWDGNNYVGRFPGHEDEKEGFDAWLVNSARYPCHDGGVWEIDEWLDGGAALARGELTPTTTPEEINYLASSIVDNAALENVVVCGGKDATRVYLLKLQEAMREEAEPPHVFQVAGYEMVEKTARPGVGTSTSARLTLPKDWAGCRVAIVRLEKKR